MTQQRRVLIVTSSYAPAMIADMHRARMLAWELPKLGWNVEVLVPGAAFQHPTCLDDDSDEFFSPEIPVHYVEEWAPQLFAVLKARSIGWRAFRPLYLHGLHWLRKVQFDLVYFSTTQFNFFLLGPIWKRRFRVPYVLDFHDPWRCDSPSYVTTSHSWKFRLSRLLARALEKWAVCRASGIVSVSPNYILTLKKRYGRQRPGWMVAQRQAVIPFGALERDLEIAARAEIATQSTSGEDLQLVYIGAGGPIMMRSFSVICRSLASLRDQGNQHVRHLRVALYGTTYGWREGGIKHLERVAVEEGVGDLVTEHPQRISYRRSLEFLLASDGALILGVDDEGYMPSKLVTYALSGKPLLASLHAQSPAYQLFVQHPEWGRTVSFDGERKTNLAEATKVVGKFLQEVARRTTFARRSALEPFLAPAMARRHAEVFEACLYEAD